MPTTYDIRAFQLDGNHVLYTPTGGMIITGPVKLGQRFTLELMTPKGSLAYLPSRGSAFIPALQLAHSTEADVLSAFSQGLLDVQRNLQLEESSSDPPQDRYLDASLLLINVIDGSVSIVVQVTSRQRTDTLLTLPRITFKP